MVDRRAVAACQRAATGSSGRATSRLTAKIGRPAETAQPMAELRMGGVSAASGSAAWSERSLRSVAAAEAARASRIEDLPRAGAAPRVGDGATDPGRVEVEEGGFDHAGAGRANRSGPAGEVPRPEAVEAEPSRCLPAFRREVRDRVASFEAVPDHAGEVGIGVDRPAAQPRHSAGHGRRLSPTGLPATHVSRTCSSDRRSGSVASGSPESTTRSAAAPSLSTPALPAMPRALAAAVV